jgi:gliding motility-associated-like protein
MINIISINTNRQLGGDNGYTLNGQWMIYSRAKLLCSNNFSSTGIYPKKINIADSYGTSGSIEQITNVLTDNIFFFGWFNKNDASTQPFIKAEVDSLYSWSIKGGKLIIGTSPDELPDITSSILNAKWGYSLTKVATCSLFPTSQGNASDIFNGPFGNVPSVNEGGSLQGFFNTVPSNSVILAREAYGSPTLYLDCNTLDLIAADIDVFTSIGDISSDSNINNNQDKFLANVIVFMDKLQDPPVIMNNENLLICQNIYSTYQWYLNGTMIQDANSQTYLATQNGSYTVEVTLDCGCKIFSNLINIDTFPKENIVFIPNIFSPNGNGQNDVLYIRGENIKEASLSIYSRWGEKVFESKDITKGWDGTYKGKPCAAEAYAYYVTITFTDGTFVQKKGNITLVR